MANDPRIEEFGGDETDVALLGRFKRLFRLLIRAKAATHRRYLSLPDYIVDRWERAGMMGFGEGTSVYDSCLVLGEVSVGKNTWVGPYTILDGSGGGLSIGDECAVSAGVHIYTHDTVDRVVRGAPIATAPVKIGDHVYIGPHAVIAKGVTIGDRAVIGAHSLVNRDVPAGARAHGCPARVIGGKADGEVR